MAQTGRIAIQSEVFDDEKSTVVISCQWRLGSMGRVLPQGANARASTSTTNSGRVKPDTMTRVEAGGGSAV